ncbi:MAG: nickel pincer cofactor biosynthesis protein LarC [Bacteroidetes bacterium]|nr:nickel pincer cofactor biosynthesis protein LarC [Bacteroidota bacterium]
MTILYYDCFSGISGDMNLGAMIDLGVDPAWLKAELVKLNLPGWELVAEKDQRHGIHGTKVTIVQTIHEHAHRHLTDIEKIINGSSLSNMVKETAIKIFRVIGNAEAKVHNIPVEKIHFHEVGAIDSIIDIVGAAICFHHLRPDAVVVSPVELGGGFVKCAHGIMPVPAPATAEIAKNLTVRYNGVGFEATTPTGAAILSVFTSTSTEINLPLRVLKTGYGVGHKEDPEVPNLLRVSLAETDYHAPARHEALLIECNIDDMNPELYSHISDRLFTAGAADVYLTEIIMKKGRPGIILSVICEKGIETAIRETIFRETTTIGVRTSAFQKSTLGRKSVEIETEFGKVTFKLSFYGGKIVSAKPESDQCREIALSHGLPLREVMTRLARVAPDKEIDD